MNAKNLEAKYLKAGINEEEKLLLHRYMSCFSNLYGSIQVKTLWDIFKQYNENITKKKFYDFIDITQKEENEYYIVNLNEAFTAETSKETKDKLLINKSLVGKYSLKYWNVGRLNEQCDFSHGPYVPNKEDLFCFDHDNFYENDEGRKMFDFLSKCKMSGYEYNQYNNEKRDLFDLNGNSTKGKYLKEVICHNRDEQFDIDYCKRENEKEYIKNKYAINCLEKILNKIKYEIMIDSVADYMDSIKRILNYILESFGVDIAKNQINDFLELYTNLVNRSNRWCLFGWSSLELSKNRPIPNGPIELQIGPNMQRMIDNGEYDIKELEKMIKDKKLNVVINKKEEKKKYSQELLEEENRKHLETFRKFLEGRNYRESVIDDHISRVDYYINHYLMWGLPKPMQEGCSLEVIGFIENKVNEEVMPPSVHNIDFFLVSISLFYECMSDARLVSKKDYELFKKDIKECKDELVEDYYDKNPKRIEIEDVIEIIEQAHGFGEGFINIKTGETELIPEDESLYVGDIDELYDKIDGPFWVEVPKVEDYQIMMSFALNRKDKKQSAQLIDILHNKKAYRKFKDAIYEMNIEDKYYDFYDSKLEELAKNWLEENCEDYDDYDECQSS